MDQSLLAALSKAFARVGKPVTKKRRRRRRRTGLITEDGRLYQAQNTLAQRLRLKREGAGVKRLATKLSVSPVDPDGRSSWRVTGGECQHTVVRQAGELICTDHAPAHAPQVEGYACSHEVAVRRFLVREVMRKGGDV